MIVDLFAGGGGASLGIEWAALGRSPDIAVNHDPEAVAMHALNHPDTRHLCGDVWHVQPRDVCGGRAVELLWLSPDCTFHSKARGAKPFRDRKEARGRRALADVAIRWARQVRPRVIILENVEEFADWGPLGPDNRPDPARRGLSFRIWRGKLEAQGYELEMRELRASDYGAPTIRKRLFIIARCDRMPIVWPTATHGHGRSQPHRAAAECIDWSLPCPSIFERKKPLADKTLRRIARGIRKFVIEAAEPFIVPTAHVGDDRVHSIRQPLRTVTGAHRGDHALVAATLQHSGNGERAGQDPRVYDLKKPLSTVMATGQKHALVSAFLARHYSGHGNDGTPATAPASTITTRDHQGLVVAHLGVARGSNVSGRPVDEPAPTVTAHGSHLADVRAFLTRYNAIGDGQPAQLSLGTVTTKARFGLVYVHGQPYEIADIGLRMLQPRELYRAQGFPDSYEIAPVVGGKPITKEAQIRMCGNSVCPPIAAALVAANVAREEAVAAE